MKSQAGAFLAGTPERALADKIRDARGNTLKNLTETEQYLFEDMRLDEEGFVRMDADLLFSSLGHPTWKFKGRNCQLYHDLYNHSK